MKQQMKSLALLLFAFAGVACTSGTETGNPPGGGEVAIMALSKETTTQALVLDQALVSFHRIALVPCAADAGTLSTYDFPVDLFHEPPARVIFESAVTDYCAVRLEITPFAGTTPPELAGLSTFIGGTRSDDIPFELRSTLGTIFEFIFDGAAADLTKLVVGVDAEAWFATADVHGAAATDGVALIDAANNPEVLTAFDAETALAFSLYVDEDGDGALTGAELTPVASAH